MKFDPVAILNYGVIGLGFLLALLSFWLLSKAQDVRGVRASISKPIYAFMVFSFAVIILGLLSEYIRFDFDRKNTTDAREYTNIVNERDRLQIAYDTLVKNNVTDRTSQLDKYTKIKSDIDSMSVNIEVCRSQSHGASTNTGDPKGCTLAALAAMKGAQDALLQARGLKGNVEALEASK